MPNTTKMSAIVKTTTTTGTFVPTSVSGCQLWLDGADSSTFTMATGVSQWNDKSGNTYNLTQSTTGSQPTRTGNYVIFQSNNYLNIPQAAINNAAAFSIFLVFNPISSLNWIIQKQADGIATQNMLSMSYYWIQNVGSTAYVYWTSTANQGPFANSGTALTLSTLQLLELTYDGTTLVIYRNGTVLSSTAGAYSLPNYTTATNCTLGAWIASGSPYNSGSTNFQLGELLHYNTFPSTTNRQSIEGYLAQKWGLRSSLPAGHPGLTTAFYGALTVPIPITTTTTVSFLPTSITGCQLWLDGADSSTMTGTTTMTSWRDKSTNAYTANSFVNSVAYPSWVSNLQNGNGAVQYSAGNGTSIANFVLAQTMSIFEVYYLINQSTGIFLEHGTNTNSGSGFYLWPGGNANFSINASASIIGIDFGNVTVSNTWQMIQGINPDPSNSNTMAFYLNGTVKASGSTQSGTTAVTKTLYINGRGGANSVSYNAYLGELIIFNTALSATNRQTIESYLAQKWGLTSSLPSGHPGLTTTVYGTTSVSLQKYKIYAAPRAVAITTKQKIVYNSVVIIYQLITLTTTATTFSYTGADQTFTAPANVYAVVAYIWGAGGGGSGQPGGAGAFAQVVVPVTPGQTYTIIVGQGGTQTSSATYGGGGFGYVGNAWAGGGRSAIRYSSADIVTLGAGAGSGQDSGSTGGVANWSPLVNSGNGYDATAAQHASLVSGKGGTQTAGGAGGAPDGGVGSAYQGGAGGLNYGGTGGTGGAPTGGGGSGYYGGGGGGGGASGPYNCTGGGGGSSLLNNVIPITGGNSPNAQAQAPGTSSSYYSGTIATGGTSGAGGNGKVVLTYATASSQIQGLTMSLSGTTVTMTWSASSYATSYYWALYYNTTNSSTGGVLNNYGSTSSVTATATVSTSGYYYFAVSGLNASGGVSQIAFSSVIQK